ncbi:DEAD/DEAH box helicase [Krasilnikovia sp. MM14-A1004]|uniref:DEAD/DEAH box helicase n=1 Tax=Krasilnikovia sp. MM14-A1004 TaxID=3373541 RepID=UPI00399D40A2
MNTAESPDVTAFFSRREARRLIVDAQGLYRDAQHLGGVPDRLTAELRQQYGQLRAALVQQRLDTMPISDLRRFSAGRLNGQKALAAANYRTVGAVLAAGEHRLQAVPGLGAPSVAAIIKASVSAQAAVAEQTVVRLDASRPTPGHTALLRGLREHITGVRIVAAADEPRQRLLGVLPPAMSAARRGGRVWRRWFAGDAAKARDQQALRELAALLSGPDTAALDAAFAELRAAGQEARQAPDAEVWRDFAQAAAFYQTLLAAVDGKAGVGQAQTGHVPQLVAQAAERVALDVRLLTVRLRAYQVFGAQYVLSRDGAILGDEMGLGKTIEAIAVMAHLARWGRLTAVVVAPASVLVNWLAEIAAHSRLPATRIHGPGREQALEEWVAGGGVAVTTYRMLSTISLPAGFRFDLLVVDEAHMIKKPSTGQSQNVAALTRHADRVLLLTGTPMENQVTEFRNLVRYVNPGLADRLIPDEKEFVDPIRFREKVAAVYLRRNQEDVLQELPGLIETDDWVELDSVEARVYADAVARRHFPDMRRAAYTPQAGARGAKIVRLREIVAESAADGWKVVVFSQFRAVIDQIAGALSGSAQIVLTGDTSPARRQEAIDRFTAYDGHQVLIGQIDAIGHGLNIQAASVVVIAEPQLKPSTEDQAIRRAYRMGQPRTVRVHRLLAKDSVDERLEDILRAKRQSFRAYAHESTAKRASASATDPRFADEEVGRVEQERIIDAEARRLYPM